MKQYHCAFAVAILLACSPAQFARSDEPKQLTFDGRLKRDPVFAAGGSEIIYSVQHESPQLILCRLNLKDGTISRVHPKSTLPEFRPTLSADEKAFAFLQMTGNDSLTLKVDLQSPNRTAAIASSKKVVWHASITPDGRQVVYSASGQIMLRPVEGGAEKQLTQSAGRNNWPAVSPDGTRIAFGSSRDGDYEIYTMKMDGSDVKRITNSRGIDMRPTWSPDGKRIALTRGRDGNYEIYVISHDGSNEIRVTDNEERDDYPGWHPDAKHLVIVAERGGKHDLFLVPVTE